MRTHAAIFLLVLAGAATAHAFLGDDFQTVAAHYGKPLRSLTRADGSQPMIYDCEGFRITVDFEDGRSVSEAFRRMDTLTPFSEETLRAFLNVHAGGQRWRETEHISGQRGWQRPGALALYDERSVRPTLIISSINYAPVDVASSRVLAATPLPVEASALEVDGGPQSLVLGGLELGHLDTGHLETGHLESPKLQTGGLQIGKLGERTRLH